MFDDQDKRVDTQNHKHHQCSDKSELLKTFDNCFTPARAYVPFQCVKTLYTPEEGLTKGTIFPELSVPYCPGHVAR